MNKKEIKNRIEAQKYKIKQKEESIKEEQGKLYKLEQDLKRDGPRMFLIRELEQPSRIAGKWNPFVTVEVYTEPDPKSLGPSDIFVKEVSR